MKRDPLLDPVSGDVWRLPDGTHLRILGVERDVVRTWETGRTAGKVRCIRHCNWTRQLARARLVTDGRAAA